MTEIPTKTCPRGHTFPVDQFHSYVDLTLKGDEAILFTCPGGKRGHHFNIVQAVAAKMFTIEEAFKVVMQATLMKARPEYLKWRKPHHE